MAATTKKLEACVDTTSCEALHACLEKARCTWIMTSPTAKPFFECGL